MTPDPSPHPVAEERSELDRAAADLQSLADAYEECARSLEALEAVVDVLLDDPGTCALVVDGEQRVLALSRGMAALVVEGGPVIGARAARLLPPGWPDLQAGLEGLARHDGWRVLPGDGVELCARRATEDDRRPVYVVRCRPSPGPA